MLNRTQAKQLFIGGIIALLLAGTLVVAGSHFRVNLQNGSSLDVKFGAESSGLVTLLGFAGIAAIIAGAVIWVQNPADNSSAGPDVLYTRLSHVGAAPASHALEKPTARSVVSVADWASTPRFRPGCGA